MQSFYPSPSQPNWGIALLVVLVLALHGLALQGLSGTWPTPTKPLPVFHVQLQNTAPTSPAQAAVWPTDTTPQPVTKHSIKPSTAPATASAPSTTHLAEPDTPPTATKATSQAIAEPPTAAAPATEPAPPPAASPPASASAPTNPAPVNNTQAGPPWLSQARFAWPPSVKLRYEFVGESKGIRYSADGDLLWQHNGNNYQLKQEVRHLLLGSRSQTSVGQSSPHGLLPLRFGDKFKQEVAAHFERDKGQVSFSANTPTQTLQEGAQDRLSLFVQLAALLAGSPQFQQAGQQISFQVVSGRSAEVWAFSVDKTETLKLPIGTLNTLKLSRVPLQQYDQTVEMWLSPQHGFLPARVRIAQTNGDVLEQFLSQVQVP